MTTKTNGAARRRVMGALAMSTVLGLAPLAVAGRASANTATVTASLVGLAQGVRGDAVRTLQQRLIAAGIPVPGGADGIFGPGTATALRQFQTAKGLPATGTVDAATAAALEAVTAGSTTTVPAPASTPPPAAPSTTTAPDPNAPTTTTTTTTATPTTTTSTPPASATATPSGTIIGLQLGARGELVRTLQQYLVTVGQTSIGLPDGVFGVRTASALSTFQRSAGLPGNAVVDQATASALLDAVARAGGSTNGATGNPAPGNPGTGTPGTGNPGSGGSGTTGATSPLLGLQRGSRGPAVKTLQQTLMQAGVSLRGGADGVFGLSTQGALKQYQQLVGLPTTGVVDEATASALASGKSVTGGTTSLVGLKSGSAGNAVKALQQALIAAGVNVRGGADGVFGPATSQALKTFQTAQGLPATGVVDEATAAALRNPRPPTTPPTTPPTSPPTTIPGSPPTTTAPPTTTPPTTTPPTTTPPTTPPPSGSNTGYAVYGEKGARVIALQQALVRAGIVVRGGVDGDFGAGTSAAVMDFQRASGLPITGRVDDATAARLGLARQDPPTPPSPGTAQLSVFPVQGRCSYVDTWLAPRSGGRQHLGVDIIAPQGKAIYAVTDGTISKIYTDHPGSLSGNGVRLSQPDGTYFFYAHMLSLAPGIAVGTSVKAGQIIGLVGTTGSSSTNHLHLEVHPKGGAAINPYPLVRAIDACNVTTVRPQP